MGNSTESLLTFWRKKRNLTQTALGAACGTDQQQIDKLEKRGERITIAWCRRLAPALHISPCDLVDGPDPHARREELEFIDILRRVPEDKRDTVIQMAAALVPSDDVVTTTLGRGQLREDGRRRGLHEDPTPPYSARRRRS